MLCRQICVDYIDLFVIIQSLTYKLCDGKSICLSSSSGNKFVLESGQLPFYIIINLDIDNFSNIFAGFESIGIGRQFSKSDAFPFLFTDIMRVFFQTSGNVLVRMAILVILAKGLATTNLVSQTKKLGIAFSPAVRFETIFAIILIKFLFRDWCGVADEVRGTPVVLVAV